MSLHVGAQDAPPSPDKEKQRQQQQSQFVQDAEDDNPLYKQDQFRMYCLKVLPCSKRYCHDWTTCPFAHPGEKAKRRDPKIYKYTGVACPEMKKNNHCPAGDKCVYAHSVWEYWLHSSRYRTQLCNDGVNCKRKICFFAHTLEELRVSSVKVHHPDSAGHAGETFELDPFAPSSRGSSHTHAGHGSSSQPHGAQAAARNGSSSASNQAGVSGLSLAGDAQQAASFSMADLQQLAQLYAKLQAATSMGTPGALQTQLQQQQQQQQQQLGSTGAGDGPEPAAMEQLQQQQPVGMSQLMSQGLANWQQQQQQQLQPQASTALTPIAGVQMQQAAQNPMAAHMQLLQMGGIMPMGEQQPQQQQLAVAAVAAGLCVGGVVMHPQQHSLLQQQQQHAAALATMGLPGVSHQQSGLAGLTGGHPAPGLPLRPHHYQGMAGGMHHHHSRRNISNKSSSGCGSNRVSPHPKSVPGFGAPSPAIKPEQLQPGAHHLAGLGLGLGPSPLPPSAHPLPFGISNRGSGAGPPGLYCRQQSLPNTHACAPQAANPGRRASLQLHPTAHAQGPLSGGTGSSVAGAAYTPCSSPTQMHRAGSGSGPMIPMSATPSFFSNQSLSRATSGSAASYHSEAFVYAEEAGPPAKASACQAPGGVGTMVPSGAGHWASGARGGWD